ncbi:MAG: hypothetical protein PVH63_02610 [Balneolaceae bacterium]
MITWISKKVKLVDRLAARDHLPLGELSLAVIGVHTIGPHRDGRPSISTSS